MFSEKRKFKNSKGLTLSAIYEGQDKNAPVVILCHGFGSSKDSESTTSLSQKLLNAGLSVYRFDFSGAGEAEGTIKDRTPLQGLDDLKAAVKNLGKENFALCGSSYGGWVSIAYAKENPILALGLKCPVSSWAPEDQPIEESNEILEDIPGVKEVENYDLYSGAKDISAAVLIVHGSADDVVPLPQSQKLLKSLGSKNKHLNILPSAGHVMRGNYLEEANNQLAKFFVDHLL